jgi:hypothetical protein
VGDYLNDGHPFRRDQLAAIGLDRRQLDRRVREFSVRRVLRGVYVDARVSDSRDLRTRAARLVMPQHGVATGCSASWLLGVDTFAPSERFDLTPQWMVPHGTTRSVRHGVRFVEGYLPPDDVITLDGISLTSPARTATDLMRRSRRPWALAAADGLAHAGLVTVAELEARIARLKGYPGVVQARELVGMVEPLAESSGESCQRLRLLDAGFPRPQAQLVLHDYAGGFIGRFDHAYEAQRVICEHDGAAFHSTPDDVLRDERRRAYVRDVLGWRVAVTRDDLFGMDARFEAKVGKWLGIRPAPRRW